MGKRVMVMDVAGWSRKVCTTTSPLNCVLTSDIYIPSLCLSIGVRKVQVAILARSSR